MVSASVFAVGLHLFVVAACAFPASGSVIITPKISREPASRHIHPQFLVTHRQFLASAYRELLVFAPSKSAVESEAILTFAPLRHAMHLLATCSSR
jgi:hypothetical protein